MDDHNNALAADGPEFRTWEDVVRWARGKVIEAAPHDGDGEDGRAFWYNKQPPGWRPDFTDVPVTPVENGGPEHRYDAGSEEAAANLERLEAFQALDPLDRPVATWGREDAARVMASPAYLRPGHTQRRRAHALVRAWFERNHGAGPAARDATGRIVRPGGGARAEAAAGGGCEIAVRAHPRDGGRVPVRAHCRSAPAH